MARQTALAQQQHYVLSTEGGGGQGRRIRNLSRLKPPALTCLAAAAATEQKYEPKRIEICRWRELQGRGRRGEPATSSAKLYAHEISNSSTAALPRRRQRAQRKKSLSTQIKNTQRHTHTHISHSQLGVGSAHPWPGFGLNRHLRASMS